MHRLKPGLLELIVSFKLPLNEYTIYIYISTMEVTGYSIYFSTLFSSQMLHLCNCMDEQLNI